MSKKNPIKIITSKLGRSKAMGLAWPDDRVIAIDSRLSGKELLDTLIHEIMHCQNPKWPEIMVAGKATELADLLWDVGYRLVDNG